MKTIELKGLDEVIYTDTCENGLKIYIWVNKKASSFKGALAFGCGSEDIRFSVSDKEYQVPYGTAHFLEHIMCKEEDGTSLLSRFQALGSFSNAATYPDKTVYEFVGADNLEANINLLLDAIQTKTFNETAFETERGPIIEEARIGKDNPAKIAFYKMNECLFHNYPNRTSGTGSEEDISKITLDDLKCFYDAFYIPANASICITGNVEPLEIIRIIKENQKKKNFPQKPLAHHHQYKEPKDVVKRKEEIALNVEIPKVYISLKIPKTVFGRKNIISILDMIMVTLLANFGNTSLFKEELLDKKLIASLATQIYPERNFLILQVVARTKYPDELIPILQEKINHLELNEKDIKRKIKSEIATMIMNYEDVENVNDLIIYSLYQYGKIIDNEKEILEKITISKIKETIKDIGKYPMSILIVNPKKGIE